MDITERLSSHFRDRQRHAPPAGVGADAVIAWGLRHRRRRAIGTTLATVAVVAAGGLGALALRSVADDTAQTPSADAASGNLGETTLAWGTYQGTLGSSLTVFAADGAFYALSTAPGVRSSDGPSLPQAVYRSEDGTTWSSELLGTDLHGGGLAARDGTLYLISTTPAVSGTSAETFGARVGLSEDEGASWSFVDLPTTATPPEGLAIQGTNTRVDIAAGDAGVVATLATHFWIDYSTLVPDEYRSGEVDVQRTATGLQVIDYSLGELVEACGEAVPIKGVASEEACRTLDADPQLTYSATWAELGITDPGPEAFTELFVSSDGATFEAVTPPFSTGSEAGLEGVYAVDGGFLAFEWSSGTQPVRAWSSPDGRAWQAISALPELGSVTAVGMVDERAVLVGTRFDPGSGWAEPLVLSSSDGGASWTPVDLTGILASLGSDAYIMQAGVGPSGAVLVMASSTNPANSLLHSKDLATWSLTPLAELDPQAGVELGWVSNVAVGTDQVVINLEGHDGTRPYSRSLVGTPAG